MTKRHFTSAISQSFGKFASKEFNPLFQTFVNVCYVKLMGLNMDEFAPYNTYPSLNKLFTRHFTKPREFSNDDKDFISPCDALITEFGDILDSTALQIKGMSYYVNDFLGSDVSVEKKAKLKNGQFMNLYLSPKDYHRYHIPADMKITKVVHIPGKFYPVNIPTLRKKVDLFSENERVVIECELANGKLMYMVLVSALNVGKMVVNFEPKVNTNSEIRTPQVYTYDNLELKKGDDFGCFEMGSTIIILSEEAVFDMNLTLFEKVRYTQNIARIK